MLEVRGPKATTHLEVFRQSSVKEVTTAQNQLMQLEDDAILKLDFNIR